MQLSRTVRLAHGSVVIRAWGAHVIDAHLTDLLTLTATLAHMQARWHDHTPDDVEPRIWEAFWRLVEVSLDDTPLPGELTWGDRLQLLETMLDLNDVGDTEKRLQGLTRKAQGIVQRAQAQTSASTKA